MKAFKVHNVETSKQEVNLPAGTYTYSCRVIPVGTSYTFRLDDQSFTFEGLTAGVLNERMKHTFELTETVSFFYLSNTIGDCVYEPQIEEGVFASTPGAHPLDFERLISEAGIEIDHEALSLYAKKADVSAEIKIQTDRIDSTVGNISNDVDGIKGDMTTISQTVNSITLTVANHTTQISTFQQTVDQIYASIEDIGSGEFSYILQRLDQIEMKVGAQGQSGSIQLALDSIASTVYDENEGMSAIIQRVNSISSTVYDEHGALLSQISQDGENVKITASQIELGGLETAGGNFIVNVDGTIKAKGAEIEGKIMSSSDGNRVIIDPDDKSVKLIDSNDETLSNIGFKEVTEGSQTFNQPYIEQLSPSAYSFTPKSFFRPSYIELTNVTGLKNTSFVFDAKNSQIILGLSGSSPGTLKINIKNLPTSDSGLSAGDLYRDSSSYLKIV